MLSSHYDLILGLAQGENAIEGVAFTHTVQLAPNGPEFIASEEAESTVLSPREFFQLRHPCSLSSTGSQQVFPDIPVQVKANFSPLMTQAKLLLLQFLAH